ncbi:uncharacterized protein STEHIDRAFT_156371 [Stereum hirsutum FP-91666 SS1]|uniref:uncharacterized protein n=1 Tax=Stereum hirsutum (strain FP-91666) TaxID=721885 RepID=UPI000440F970|nr:uncharacterized protein STEHIDRAFT_156371 [Stereum hirsutum FP-91666 SS1]EIM87397.1 hypothetical protein STEHIDRAFT_156371 [Stereum hirsutum FP-91666 SS1]
MLVASKILAAFVLGATLAVAIPACLLNDNDVACKVDSDCPTAGDNCCLLSDTNYTSGFCVGSYCCLGSVEGQPGTCNIEGVSGMCDNPFICPPGEICL